MNKESARESVDVKERMDRRLREIVVSVGRLAFAAMFVVLTAAAMWASAFPDSYDRNVRWLLSAALLALLVHMLARVFPACMDQSWRRRGGTVGVPSEVGRYTTRSTWLSANRLWLIPLIAAPLFQVFPLMFSVLVGPHADSVGVMTETVTVMSWLGTVMSWVGTVLACIWTGFALTLTSTRSAEVVAGVLFFAVKILIVLGCFLVLNVIANFSRDLM